MHLYALHGLRLASEIPLAAPLVAATGPVDLTVVRGNRSESAMEALTPRYTSPWTVHGEPVSRLAEGPEGLIWRFAEGLTFTLGAERIAVAVHRPAAETWLEIRLLGPVLALWLERSGLGVLHASAVAVDGEARVFLAGNRGGKSTLAAALVEAGCPLLSDDLLAVEAADGALRVHPGVPRLRLWPDGALRFVGAPEGLPRVHPEVDKLEVPVGGGELGGFHDGPLPVGAVYLPERRAGTTVAIEPMSRRDAVVELVRHTFLPHIVEALGWQACRFGLWTRLAGRLPVRRLAVPEGYGKLPAVLDAVLADRP